MKAEIDIRTGGRYYYRMERTDGKEGFDFAGTYSLVVPGERIECIGDDGRKTINTFSAQGEETIVKELFEPDTHTPIELQLQFCQHILDNFKRYMEQE